MSYYQGDFYVGDPGFFGSVFSLGKRLLGGALGFGGGGGPRMLPAAGAMTGAAATAAVGLARRVGGGIARHPVLSAAGAAGTIGALGGVLGERAMLPGGAPLKGFHMSKPHARYGVYPKPPHLVRNRRMRVTNPRALRRAIRRCSGFGRLAKRVLRFTSPRAPRGRAYFRAKRRKRV